MEWPISITCSLSAPAAHFSDGHSGSLPQLCQQLFYFSSWKSNDNNENWTCSQEFLEPFLLLQGTLTQALFLPLLNVITPIVAEILKYVKQSGCMLATISDIFFSLHSTWCLRVSSPVGSPPWEHRGAVGSRMGWRCPHSWLGLQKTAHICIKSFF